MGKHRRVDTLHPNVVAIANCLPTTMAESEWLGMSILLFPQNGIPHMLGQLRAIARQSRTT